MFLAARSSRSRAIRAPGFRALGPFKAFILLALAFAPAHAQTKKAIPQPRNGPPVIKASSAILLDAISGQVLFEKNADVLRPPASTTKIMTAILLLEHTKPEDQIRASCYASETDGSSLHLLPGET